MTILQFKPGHYSSRHSEAISIIQVGFSLPLGLQELHDMRRYRFVNLSYNTEKMAIIFTFTRDRNENSIALRSMNNKSNKRTLVIGAKSFFKFIKVSIDKYKNQYQPIVESKTSQKLELRINLNESIG